MPNHKVIAGALGALVSVSILAVESAPSTVAAMSSATLAEGACGPILTPPDDSDPTAPKPSPPTNLRIMGSGQEAYLEPEEGVSGPYVGDEEATGGAAAISHGYFDMLTSRADCLVAYSMRSQSQLDAVETRGESNIRLPILYDSSMDAASVRVDPSGATPGSGSTDSQQKRFWINISGGSMLLTWDFRFDSSFAFKNSGDLKQHKTWKLTYGDNLWLTWKTSYARGTNSGKGVAEMFMASQNKAILGPGTTNDNSEILEPRLAEFYIQPNTWTRYWLLVEGSVSGGGLVYVSVWAADESRNPIQLYKRLALYSPANGLSKFWLEYDASQDEATNGLMKSWNRNLVILKNPGDISGLLQRPVL